MHRSLPAICQMYLRAFFFIFEMIKNDNEEGPSTGEVANKAVVT